VQPNTCTHKHNIHVDVSSKGWQVFGIPVKEENSDNDGFNEELKGKIKEIDEIVKEEEVYCDEEFSCEKPDQGLKVKENDLENYVFVKVGILDSDESKKEDTTDGDLYILQNPRDIDDLLYQEDDLHMDLHDVLHKPAPPESNVNSGYRLIQLCLNKPLKTQLEFCSMQPTLHPDSFFLSLLLSFTETSECLLHMLINSCICQTLLVIKINK
ncbi:hypothetical protein Hamer_G016326, partial [Homarus americanus]